MRPLTKHILILALGACVGGAVTSVLDWGGVNFRLLPYSKNGYTFTPPDAMTSRDEGERIFALFAHGLRLPCNSADVLKVMNAKLLTRDMISEPLLLLAGQIPVHWGDNDVFTIHPSPGRVIWVSISGGARTRDDALAFFTGTGSEKFKLEQFALIYPSGANANAARMERFSWWGIHSNQ